MSDTQEAVQSRLIGEIFLERGFVDQSQLEAALAKQRETGMRLGEILVADYGVSRLELAGVLAEQWAALERAPKPAAAEPATPSSSGAAATFHEAAVLETPEEIEEEGVRRPIGEIFVERGIISEAQLKSALEVQASTGKRLGEVLVEQGSLSRLDLAGALAEQWAGLQKLRPPTPKPKPEPWQQRAIRGEAAPETTRALGHANDELKSLRAAVDGLEARLVAVEESGGSEAWRDELAAAARTITVRLEGLEERLGDIDQLSQAGQELRIALGEIRDRPVVAVERIDALEQRLGDLVGSAATAEGVDDLRTRLGEMHERLEALPDVAALAERVTATETRVETAATDIAGLAGRLDELAASVPSRTDLDGLGARLGGIDALAARVDEIASGTAAADAVAGVEAEVARLAGLVEAADGVRGEIAQVAARVETLEQAVPADAAVAALQSEVVLLTEAARSLDGLQEGLAAATSRIEGLEQASGTVRPEALDELRSEVARLGEELSGEMRGALDSAVRRIDELSSRGDTVEASALTVLRADLERLEAAVIAGGAVEGRVEALEEAARPLDEMWSRVRALETGAQPVEDMAARLAHLEVRVEGLAEADGEAIADIRSTLETMSTGAPDEETTLALRAVEQRVADIEQGVARRVDEALAVERAARDGLSVRIDDAARRLSELQSLNARLDELQERIDAGDHTAALGELHEAHAGLAARVEQGLLGGDLADRIAGAASRAELANAVASIQAEVGAVSARLGDVVTEARGVAATLDARLPEMIGRPELLAFAGDVQARLAQTEERLAGLSPDIVAQLEERLAALQETWDGTVAERVGSLEARLEHTATADAVEDVRRAVAELADAPAAVRDALRAELDDRLAALDGMRETVDALVARLDGVASIDALDELRSSLAAVAEVPAQAPEQHVESVPPELAAQVDALRARLDQTASWEALEDIRHALSDLADEPAAMREELRAELGARLGAIDEMRAAVDSLGARLHGAPTWEALEERLRGISPELAGRLDALGARLDGAPTWEALEDLRRTVAEAASAPAAVRDELLAALDARLSDVHDLRGRLDALGQQLDGVPSWQALDELRASLAGLADDRVAAVEQRLAGLSPELEALRARLDQVPSWQAFEEMRGSFADATQEPVAALSPELVAQLDVIRARLDRTPSWEALDERLGGLSPELVAQLDALRSRLDGAPSWDAIEELRRAVADAAGGQATVRDEVRAELDARLAALDGMRATLDTLQTAASRPDHTADIDALRADLLGQQDVVRRLDETLHERDGRLGAAIERGAAEQRQQVEALRHEIEVLRAAAATDVDARARLDRLERLVRETGSRIDEHIASVTAGLATQLDGARGESAAVREALADTETSLVTRIDDVAVRLAAEIADQAEAARALADRADERARAAAAAAVDELAAALRAEIDQAAVDTARRLAGIEEAVATSRGNDLEKRLGRLEKALAAQQELVEAQGRSVEKAVKKGLGRLGRQIAEAEDTYLGATDAFRRTLSALGEVIAEPDPGFAAAAQPAVDEPRKKKAAKKAARGEGAAPAGTYVAFVPSPDGYQLVELTGAVPEQGDEVETEAGRLTVRRVSRSPLPFDERACAYLERT